MFALFTSLIEIMPLVRISDAAGKLMTIGAGRPGPITLKLMAAYKEAVEQYTASKKGAG